MKTVASFSKPEEAHLFRARLESVGIPAFLQDEHMVQTNWLYSNAIGGVRVQIAEEDVEAAKEFIEEEKSRESLPSAVACPECGSRETKVDELPRRVAFLSLLLVGIPLLFTGRRWRCGACDFVWKLHGKQAATAPVE